MKLDLRFNASINRQFNELFNSISYLNRNNFNNFIDSISRSLIDNVDWWAESPASRNTYACPLFHYFCSINLILKIFNENIYKINKIYVDSNELKKIIENILIQKKLKHVKVIYKLKFSLSLRLFLKKYLYYEWFFIKRLIQIIISRISKKYQNFNIPNKSIVLVDTFLTKEYLNNDRWYGSLWDHLDEDLKSEIFFVPSITNTSLKNIKIIYKALRQGSRNTIIKEDYLTIYDLIYAYQHKHRVKKLKIDPYTLSGIDLSGIVVEVMQNNRDVYTLMESLLTYRFLNQLSLKKINVRLSIDWFEGHSLDKLWNLGMKNFFPKVKRIGYETFRNYPYNLSTFPILIEREAGTIPDIFAVQGKSCVSYIREFLPNQDVMVVPAFKYEHVWTRKINKFSKDQNKVLVSLPISLGVSIRILQLLIDTYNNHSIVNNIISSYILRPHPANTINQIKNKLKKNIPLAFKFTNEKSFSKELENSSILITEASSTCLEALAYGIAVIIIENPTGLTYDPVPKDIPKDLFIKCRTSETLSEAIQHFLNYKSDQLKNNNKIGMEIRNKYFEKITKKGIYKFLDINFYKE